MEAVQAPTCQIHHTYKDDWVVSFYDLEKYIYSFDSLGIYRQVERIIASGLSIRLCLIYGNNKKDLQIIIPEMQNM